MRVVVGAFLGRYEKRAMNNGIFENQKRFPRKPRRTTPRPRHTATMDLDDLSSSTREWDDAPLGNQAQGYFRTLHDESSFFFQREELCSSDGCASSKNFLSTANVYSCFAVFAWSPPTAGECVKGYGAHVDLGCLLDACRPRPHRSGLPQLTHSLKRHFGQREVRVTIAGGQEGDEMDESVALRGRFPGNKKLWRFSTHVLQVITNARLVGCGASQVVTSRLFPARALGDKKYGGASLSDEFEARRAGARFQFATLHLLTGKVFTHTKEHVRGTAHDSAMAEFHWGENIQRRYVRTANFVFTQTPMGSPLVDAGKRCANVACQETTMEAKKRCGSCKRVRYCSVTCQQTQWQAEHEKSCAGKPTQTPPAPPVETRGPTARREPKAKPNDPCPGGCGQKVKKCVCAAF